MVKRFSCALLAGGTGYGVGLVLLPAFVRLAIDIGLAGRGSSALQQVLQGLVILGLWSVSPMAAVAMFRRAFGPQSVSSAVVAVSAVIGLVAGMLLDEHLNASFTTHRSVYAPLYSPLMPAGGVAAALFGTLWRRGWLSGLVSRLRR